MAAFYSLFSGETMSNAKFIPIRMDAIASIRANISTLTASDYRLLFYVWSIDPFGDGKAIDAASVMVACGISRSAYYNSMGKLISLDLVAAKQDKAILSNVSIHHATEPKKDDKKRSKKSRNLDSQSRNLDSQSRNLDLQSRNLDSQSRNLDLQSRNLDSQSRNLDSTVIETVSQSASQESLNTLINTYINTDPSLYQYSNDAKMIDDDDQFFDEEEGENDRQNDSKIGPESANENFQIDHADRLAENSPVKPQKDRDNGSQSQIVGEADFSAAPELEKFIIATLRSEGVAIKSPSRYLAKFSPESWQEWHQRFDEYQAKRNQTVVYHPAYQPYKPAAPEITPENSQTDDEFEAEWAEKIAGATNALSKRALETGYKAARRARYGDASTTA
jgi:hypothetical protein